MTTRVPDEAGAHEAMRRLLAELGDSWLYQQAQGRALRTLPAFRELLSQLGFV